MKHVSAVEAARTAVAANATRPATAVIHDSDDVRLVVFRLAPGQEVAQHHSKASVTLTVLEGTGLITGENQELRCKPGEIVAYAPNELHGMRADAEEFLLLATIAPKPGKR